MIRGPGPAPADRRGRGFRAVAVALALAAPAPALHAAPPPYRPPAPVVRTLPNGLTVAVFVDRRLSIAHAALLVPAGSIQETPREPGVASLTAALLARGTASRTAAEFAADLARLGATPSGNAGREYTTLSVGLGAADLEPALELLADAALNPVFPEEEIELVRGRLLQQLAASRQSAGALVDEHAVALAFAGHPAGHPVAGSFETLTDLHRAQVQEFHRRCFRPDRALLGVAGDVDAERVFAIVERAFGAWSGRAPAAPAPRFAGGGPRVRILDLPGRAQAEFRLVMPGPGREEARAAAAQVLAALFESGRDARGRALSREERASVTALRGGGLVTIAGSAPADSLVARLQAVRAAFARLASPDPAGVEAARRRLGDGHALQFETLAGVLGQWMLGRAAGLSDDEPLRYAQRLATVEPAAVAAEAAAAGGAGDWVLVVAGPAARLRDALAALGPVEVVEAGAPSVTALTPSRTTAPPSPEETAAGRRLIGQAIAAHGGQSRLAGIKDSVVEADVTLVMEGRELTGTLRETRKDPGRYLAAMMVRANFGQQGLDGSRGWVTSSAIGDTVLPADSVTVAALRTALASDVVHLLRLASDPSLRLAARGRERLGGGEAEVVELVESTGARRVLFLDPATHRVLALEQQEGMAAADPPVRRLYGDYRQVTGVWWPFSEVRTVRGTRLMTVQTRNVRFNTGVADDVFQVPGRGLPGAPTRIRR